MADTAHHVHSRDGTTIAFDRIGAGPALVLVGGALGVRSHVGFTQLAALLETHFTVFNYDRRGRGDSGDTQPYAVEREIDDIAAVIDAAGGEAYVYGISSGAILALEATNVLQDKVTKLALYDAPFLIDASRPPLSLDYVERLNTAVAEGRRGDAVEIFLKALLLPNERIALMKADPSWDDMERIAHTIAYDGMVVRQFMAGQPLPSDRWNAVTMPTLVMTGEYSEPFFHDGAHALVDLLSNAHYRMLAGHHHGVEPHILAPVLVGFFRAD